VNWPVYNPERPVLVEHWRQRASGAVQLEEGRFHRLRSGGNAASALTRGLVDTFGGPNRFIGNSDCSAEQRWSSGPSRVWTWCC
jgi:hypothetical protein